MHQRILPVSPRQVLSLKSPSHTLQFPFKLHNGCYFLRGPIFGSRCVPSSYLNYPQILEVLKKLVLGPSQGQSHRNLGAYSEQGKKSERTQYKPRAKQEQSQDTPGTNQEQTKMEKYQTSKKRRKILEGNPEMSTMEYEKNTTYPRNCN